LVNIVTGALSSDEINDVTNNVGNATLGGNFEVIRRKAA
jgi:hypothetical protein